MKDKDISKKKLIVVTALALTMTPLFCNGKYCEYHHSPDLPAEGGFSYDFNSGVSAASISGTLSSVLSTGSSHL